MQVGVFFEVVERLVFYGHEQVGVGILNVGEAFPVDPTFGKNVRNYLFRPFFLMNVHHTEFNERHIQQVEERFECLVVIVHADAFPQM